MHVWHQLQNVVQILHSIMEVLQSGKDQFMAQHKRFPQSFILKYAENCVISMCKCVLCKTD